MASTSEFFARPSHTRIRVTERKRTNGAFPRLVVYIVRRPRIAFSQRKPLPFLFGLTFLAPRRATLTVLVAK